MDLTTKKNNNCILGKDYPNRIVIHEEAIKFARNEIKKYWKQIIIMKHQKKFLRNTEVEREIQRKLLIIQNSYLYFKIFFTKNILINLF